jgi:hypothetical protein
LLAFISPKHYLILVEFQIENSELDSIVFGNFVDFWARWGEDYNIVPRLE